MGLTKEQGPTDAELVAQAVQGERRAKELLYRRHRKMIVGLAHRLLGGGEVDDLVQEAFVTAFERLGTLRDGQAFAKWIGSILVHLARKQIERRQRWRLFRREREQAAPAGELIAADAPPDVRVELQHIYQVVDSLPADARIALLLRRVEGMSIAEVAECMGRSPATVKRRIQDGDFLLRTKLGRGTS